MWGIEKLYEVMSKLQKKGSNNEGSNLMYLINPFADSMGYDVFNMDEVELDIHGGRLTANVFEDLKLVIGLTSYMPSTEHVKVFLHVDVREYRLTMHLRALDQWEKIGVIDVTKQDEVGEYPQLMRMLTKDSLRSSYSEKGERLFTEGVLRKQLEAGEYNNRFVKSVIRDELKRPSEAMIRVIAERLTQEFSSDDVSSIVRELMPLQDEGLEGIVTSVLPKIKVNEDEVKKSYDTTTTFRSERGNVVMEDSRDKREESKEIFRGEKGTVIAQEDKKEDLDSTVFRAKTRVDSIEEGKISLDEPEVIKSPPLKRSRGNYGDPNVFTPVEDIAGDTDVPKPSRVFDLKKELGIKEV